MFSSMESGAAGARRAAGRSNEPASKLDFVKTFYYDPAKWDLIKSIGFFGLAVYLIRDFAANDLIPME